ncbi:MAG: cytidylate kinase-like family protein [Actinomycetota bacterium]
MAMESTRPRPVVTIWETYGAGMEEVGRLVAEELGVELHSKAYTPAEVAAAGRSGRIGDGDDEIWFLVGPRGSSLQGYHRSDMLRGIHEQHQRIAAQLTEDVEAEASRGAVLLGRNATYILRDWPNVLHVKLDGPVKDRIARAAAAQGISLEEAAEQEQWHDEVRSQVCLELFDWNPLEYTYYDMVFNTSHLPFETCAALIADAAWAKAAAAEPSGPSEADGAESI